ncbi:peptide-methionine (S)-S-oxide reductase MsrA [Kiritimatiellota bacterium B12222]|nr:peptide-methionine (S)-S-oxide reductase MsrA [Kiritimatiellota bacterium B12222]
MMKSIILCAILTLTGGVTMAEQTQPLAKASFGAGCFWCVEPFFEQLKGVESVRSGYQGGSVKNPSYKEVTSGKTGHAEAVEVTYNPDIISYTDLLEVFFDIHDPTTLNRQGADRGTQYRSTILYYTEDQKAQAEAAIKKLNQEKVFSNPVVTTVEMAGPFYVAESYHQNYYAQNPTAPYCRLVIAPKLKKIQLREDLLKD